MKQSATFNVRYKAWLAVFAFLVQALLPAAVYAAGPGQTHVSEICTAFGIKQIAVGDASAADSMSAGRDCPVCSLTALVALPLSANVPDFYVQPRFTPPVSSAERPPFAPVPLRPYLRGPPFLS